MAIVVPQTLQTLLGYFQTGDKPTQDQFEELIRTAFYQYQESLDIAQAAQDAVTAAIANYAKQIARAACRFSISGDTGWEPTIISQFNVSAVAAYNPSGDQADGIDVTFENAFTDGNYIAVIYIGANGDQAASAPISQSAGSIRLKPGAVQDENHGGTYSLLIFDPR